MALDSAYIVTKKGIKPYTSYTQAGRLGKLVTDTANTMSRGKVKGVTQNLMQGRNLAQMGNAGRNLLQNPQVDTFQKGAGAALASKAGPAAAVGAAGAAGYGIGRGIGKTPMIAGAGTKNEQTYDQFYQNQFQKMFKKPDTSANRGEKMPKLNKMPVKVKRPFKKPIIEDKTKDFLGNKYSGHPLEKTFDKMRRVYTEAKYNPQHIEAMLDTVSGLRTEGQIEAFVKVSKALAGDKAQWNLQKLQALQQKYPMKQLLMQIGNHFGDRDPSEAEVNTMIDYVKRSLR